MNDDFRRTLQKRLEFFNGKSTFAVGSACQSTLTFTDDRYPGPEADAAASAQKKLDDVKVRGGCSISECYFTPEAALFPTQDIMVQNIEMVLERGEKLDLLVDKTNKLQLESFKFQNTSKQLRQAMFWKKVRTSSGFAAGGYGC